MGLCRRVSQAGLQLSLHHFQSTRVIVPFSSRFHPVSFVADGPYSFCSLIRSVGIVFGWCSFGPYFVGRYIIHQVRVWSLHRPSVFYPVRLRCGRQFLGSVAVESVSCAWRWSVVVIKGSSVSTGDIFHQYRCLRHEVRLMSPTRPVLARALSITVVGHSCCLLLLLLTFVAVFCSCSCCVLLLFLFSLFVHEAKWGKFSDPPCPRSCSCVVVLVLVLFFPCNVEGVVRDAKRARRGSGVPGEHAAGTLNKNPFPLKLQSAVNAWFCQTQGDAARARKPLPFVDSASSTDRAPSFV